MPRICPGWLLLIMIAGCEPSSMVIPRRSEPSDKRDAGEASVIRAALKQSSDTPREPSAVGAGFFQELIPLIRPQKSQPQTAQELEAWYGIWVADRGGTRTRMRIERPLIQIVAIDKKTSTSRVMDGHYAVAPNGMMYGVMTGFQEATQQPEHVQALLDDDERALRGVHVEKRMMPFCCWVGRDGDDLTMTDFRGTALEKHRDALIHGRYQPVSLGRPSCAVPGPPLGTWVMTSGNTRLTLVIQPGRFEIRLLDRVSGRRVHSAGNYDVAPAGIIFGVITSVEHGEVGAAMTEGHISPLVLCFHFGWRGNALVIDEVRSLGLERKTEECLIGEFRPPKP
jgi:hypothetical protein